MRHNTCQRTVQGALIAALVFGWAAPAMAQKLGAVAPRRTAPVPPHNADTFGHYTPQWRRWPHDWQQAAAPRIETAPKPAAKTDDKPAETVPKPEAKKPADEMPPPPPAKDPQAPPSAMPATPDEAPLTAPPGDDALPTTPLDDNLPPLELEPPAEPGAMPEEQPLPLDTGRAPPQDEPPALDTDPAPKAAPDGSDDLPPLDFDDAPTTPPGGGAHLQSRSRTPGRRSTASAATGRNQRGGLIGRWPQKPAAPAPAVDPRRSTNSRQLRRGEATEVTQLSAAPRSFVPAGDVERLPPVARQASAKRPSAQPRRDRAVEPASWTAAEGSPQRSEASPQPPQNSGASPSGNPLRKPASEGWQPSGSRLQSNPLRSAG